MLYLVPTPIGNLADVTYRAIDTLNFVDLIACEDTRSSGVFLSHYGISTSTISYHNHNERSRAPQLIDRMKAGQQIALISDAGSPGLSDPGFYLVRLCWEESIPVQALPGPTALIPALTASGIPSERFVFEGFLPTRKGRNQRLEAIKLETRTVVLYESPHRLIRTLIDLINLLGEQRVSVIAREITKKFEEISRGDLQTLLDKYHGESAIKGEFVIIIAPPKFTR
ncbi:MAG: 16S rRNA (cytidine(1402)-2'-O)-methyltransferase [Bacteroidetes bacterium]|nr:16S rRNA (cytidine(1402)-2'-O)-methyltransferase [Bacteroidota bacterium]MCY4206131.1 16S rRNA (cytidine(1402)-2'-O)-methyltransferase [Bacteroidota bacterium]